MSIDTPVNTLVRQLRQVGRRPSKNLVQQICSHGAEAREALVALAAEKELLHRAEPICWGPLHALRLLGEMADVSIIEPLFSVLPIEVYSEEEAAPQIWSREVLEIVACCGVEAVPILWAWADDDTRSYHARGAAMQTMIYITELAPEVYDEVVADAQARFQEENDRDRTTILVYLLAHLQVAAVYKDVLAAYRANLVDTEIIPAAGARKLLLGSKKEPYIVPRTFWERYDMQG